MAEESKITPQQPQTEKALDIKDPSTVDDTANFQYNVENNFNINDYNTSTQDVKNIEVPTSFPNDSSKNLAPTTSPFILQLNGSGFISNIQSVNPFSIYAKIDNFIAIIPPLPTSTNLLAGTAYGYVVKSDTLIWIYFNRILFQNIWFQAPINIDTYNGQDDPNKIQIESATSTYKFLSNVPQLTLFVAPNNGTLSFKSNFFSQDAFKKIDIKLSQSPYILTIRGFKKGSGTVPFTIPSGNATVRFLSLFGHGLQNKKVLMLKTSSKLLQQNPSALPESVLTANQDASTIQNMPAKSLAALEFFKIGNFLEELQTTSPSQITNYNFFSADGITIKNSGPKGHLVDQLPTIKFNILTLPTGTYYVVIYDNNTGVYSKAPDIITFNAQLGGMQIHDISPSTVILNNPTFTINGFNFPTQNDITNGATLTIVLTNSVGFINNIVNFTNILATPFLPTAKLTINKDSTTNDINNNGTITLASNKIEAKFTNLNFIPGPNDSNVLLLQIQTIFPVQEIKTGKIDDIETSQFITIQSPPIIHFLTNSETFINQSQSLVRVDQTTGQVIANGIPSNDLFIVGSNFGDGKNISVSIKGNNQQVNEIKPWIPNTSLSAIRITVDPANIKGDATVEVKAGEASSEPFSFTPTPPLKIIDIINNTIKNSKGLFTKGEQRIITPFDSILPYDHRDGYTLLNSQNTKVSASVSVKLSNFDTKQSVSLNGKLDSTTPISFLPNQVIIPDNTKLNSDGTLSILFNFYSIFNVNLSTPKIVKLLHNGVELLTPFNPKDIMTVVGTGFVNGMRFNINKSGWKPVNRLYTILLDSIIYQAFDVEVPDSNGASNASIQVSNDQAASVSSSNASGKQNGPYKVETIVVNDKYSPLLQINQRLPAGIKMYAKGPQVAMTDKIDANMSIYGQMTPFLGSFKTLLIVIRIIVCIIDVICALINPFKLIVAIIALMDCVIDLLSLFPQLAVPIMILSFLQNFIGFLLTFIEQIKTYVFSIVNSQLSLAKAQTSKDFASLAAGEQQSFASTKQMRDVISFLEPPLQILKIFKDLLMFSMHLPCASQHGGTQEQESCPPQNMQDLIDSSGDQEYVKAQLKHYAAPFLDGKYPTTDNTTLATMFCQAVAIQTATLQTMPGAPTPGASSVVSNISPTLPDVASAIECMTLLTDNIEGALNKGEIFIKTSEQGQQQIDAFIQCVQNLIDQTNKAIGDVCPLAVSALNSEIKVSPKGGVKNNLGDDFIRTKIALPSTQPNDTQDAGLTLDLPKLTDINDIPITIATDPNNGSSNSIFNFGLKQDIFTPVIIQTTNKSGQRQSINTIYFNAENPDVGDLIVVGDIFEIVGGIFNGLQFPILGVQKIFTSIRLTVKLDITFEQKLIIGEQSMPLNLSNFDVKVIAHLAGNDAVAVVPADNSSLATVQIIARDHHGHEIGPGLSDKVAIKLESGNAEFVLIPPSSTTDITGLIQEEGTHYIANLKSDCAGTTIVSASVCNIEFVDLGYHANDPNHVITTRKKTARIIFTPEIPAPSPGQFVAESKPQEPGTKLVN